MLVLRILIGIPEFSHKRSDTDVTANSNCPRQLLLEPPGGHVSDRQYRQGKFVLEF
jgi:hypothetical protein